MSARERMLARIREATGGAAPDPDVIEAEEAELVSEPAGLRPAVAPEERIERFVERATSERVAASVERLPALADVPDAASRYLAAHELAPPLALQPAERLLALDWGETGRAETRLAADAPAALTLADYGIAETGSLVVTTGPEAPLLHNLLPLHHLVVVEVPRVLSYMEDVFAALAHEGRLAPRGLAVITGTSGTADIEGQLIRGAHGPRYVHILLVGA